MPVGPKMKVDLVSDVELTESLESVSIELHSGLCILEVLSDQRENEFPCFESVLHCLYIGGAGFIG